MNVPRSSRKARVLALGFASLTFASPLSVVQPANAAEVVDVEANHALRAGTAAFEASMYVTAIGHFERGYLLTSEPRFLQLVGRCYRKLGERSRARFYLESYLAEAPEASDAARVRSIIASLAVKGSPAADRAAIADTTGEAVDMESRLYAEGKTAYNAGDYRVALARFAAAYSLDSDPLLHRAIGHTHYKLGHFEEARRRFESYLRDAPHAGHHEEVRTMLSRLDTREAAIRGHEPPEASEVASAVPVGRPLDSDLEGYTLRKGGILMVAIGGGVLLSFSTVYLMASCSLDTSGCELLGVPMIGAGIVTAVGGLLIGLGQARLVRTRKEAEGWWAPALAPLSLPGGAGVLATWRY